MRKKIFNKITYCCAITILLSLTISSVLFICATNVKTAQIKSENCYNTYSISNLTTELNDAHVKKIEEFTFEGLFDSSILYRDTGNTPYFLALSSNNSPKYVINKQYIKKFHIDTIFVDHCVINTQKGNIVRLGEIYFTTNCEDYKITENSESITLDSRYETPINSAKISVMSGDESRSILVHNTTIYDKDHNLAHGLWTLNKKHNEHRADRIVFFKPKERKTNFLTFQKNISKNFTIHLSVEPSDGNTHACPYILLNGEVSIDFGHQNGNALLIRYKKNVDGKIVDEKISTPINKQILSKYYQVTISKFNNMLKILVCSKKYTNGTYETLFENNDIFLDKRWSTFSIGNTKGAPGFELQSIMIVGREDV